MKHIKNKKADTAFGGKRTKSNISEKVIQLDNIIYK